jgi:MmyB-like transcription regulator ligand binding domain
MLAQFRATHDLWGGDPAFAELVDRLRQASTAFDGWWDAHDIRAAVSGRKTLVHPSYGLLRFDHASFQANDDPALKLVIYAPA